MTRKSLGVGEQYSFKLEILESTNFFLWVSQVQSKEANILMEQVG